MSRSKEGGGLTAEELKRKMYQSLQSAGVLNNLKGYLRQSVINELRGRYKNTEEVANDSESDLLAATLRRNAEGSWNQKAIDNLVLFHLKQSRYLYSLSLFQQEASITVYDEALTEELLLRLGASPDLLKSDNDKENNCSFPSPNSSSTPVANGDDPKLLLWKILSRISSAQNLAMKIDENSLKQTQQDKPKAMSLAEKFQAIDDEMDGTLRERRYNDIEHRKSIITLASATRRAEEAAEKRARESFEQWKKVELASTRVKEQEKSREQVVEKTRQLENDFAQRKEALLMREKNAIERLNNQKELLEKDLHHQRQTLLHELEQIRVREKNLKEREQMQKDTEAVKLRVLDVLKIETLGHQGQAASFQGHGSIGEKTRRDSVVSSVAESLKKSLTGRESRQLDEVLHELNSRSDEAEMLRRELMHLKDELTDTKAQLQQITCPEPRPSPRPRDISSRDAGDQSLRKRLDDLSRQLNDWKEKDKVEREATIQSEVSRWRTEISKLSEARDRLDEKHHQLDDLTSRVGARLSATPRSPRPEPKYQNRLSSTSLRILMDPQSDITRDPSIRDYGPVHTGRVRWADEMPHSVRPDLMESRSPRRAHYHLHNTSGNSVLDSSNDTTSSNDLLTSGLRKDIREKFKTLEKESDDLEQMYKRYIQSNYKHISADPQDARRRTQVHTFSRDFESKPTLQPDPLPTPKPKISPRNIKPTVPEEHQLVENLNETQGPLDLRSLEKKGSPSPPLVDDKSSTQSTKIESQVSESPIEDLGSMDPKTETATSGGGNPAERKPESLPESSISKKPDLSKLPPQMGVQPTPRKRQSTLLPIGGSSKSMRSIPSHNVEVVFGGPRQNFGGSPQNSGEDSGSSFSSEFSLPMKKSSMELPEQEKEKSPFERPALLEQKREELQCSFDQPEPQSMNRDINSPVHEESPKHDIKFELDLHDDDGIQNILDSIDVRSARSIEADTDPKLADLLNQLEPAPTVISQSIGNDVTRKPIVISMDNPGADSQSEDSSSIGKDEKKTPAEPPAKECSYSDEEFLSSTGSKTASEVKTMSDFEPSSTSIPRIEDKLTGLQQSDEDKSEADVNWSNLQLDKSGELPRFDPKQDSPRVEETKEKVHIDVFEDSQSGNSFEAPSDGGNKSRSSGEDFW